MLKVLTAQEMSRADRSAIDSGIPSFHLMKAAGHAVAEAATQMMGGTYGRRVTVLCGRGNNGGDGLVAAGHLARRGAGVRVLLSCSPQDLKEDARKAFDVFVGSKGTAPVARLDGTSLARAARRTDLFLDALVGTGFQGALRGEAAEAAEWLNRSSVKVLSVDIPSGVDASTGRVEAVAVRADRTVTLAALKPGLLCRPGRDYAGEVEIADIGIGEEHLAGSMRLAGAPDAGALMPQRSSRAHKRSVGKVLVVAGSRGMSGAAALTASAALRTGAGLVWVATPQSAAPLVESAVTEAIVEGMPETSSGSMGEGAIEPVLALAEAADSLALGPGISSDEETRHLVFRLLDSVTKPLIVDADGINAYRGNAEALASRSAPTVLTPHAGELARLLGEDVKEIDSRPFDSARLAAQTAGAVVLLKGHPTFVASGEQITIVDSGGPFLATAGTGDVLTGVIAALAASVAAEPAAWAGAWLHGTAGRIAAQRAAAAPGGALPDRGMIASDLLLTLPEAVFLARSAAAEQ